MTLYYQDDFVSIFNGNCIEILKELPSKSIDLVITDPPYGIDFHGRGKGAEKIANDKSFDNVAQLIQQVIPELVRLLKDDAEIYWFCSGGSQKPLIAQVWLEFIKLKPQVVVKNLIIWDKLYPGLGWDWRFQYETIFQLYKGKGIKSEDHCRGNVISARKVIPKFGEHPTPKSPDIIEKLLLPKSKPGDVILDPFLGGGTTAAVAKKHGRHCIGIELIDKYCEFAAERCRGIHNNNLMINPQDDCQGV